MERDRLTKHSFEYYLLAASFLIEDGFTEEALIVIDHINNVWPDRNINLAENGLNPNIPDEEL